MRPPQFAVYSASIGISFPSSFGKTAAIPRVASIARFVNSRSAEAAVDLGSRIVHEIEALITMPAEARERVRARGDCLSLERLDFRIDAG